MKKIFVILTCCFLLSCSCNDEKGVYNDVNKNSIAPQEWFDKFIRHSEVTDSAGHTLILHEYGSRTNIYGSYSFSIEHSPICKKCCEIYD